MPSNESTKYILYRVYYGDQVVYVGRTGQKLQNRIRGHIFGKPMHRKIDIDFVSKIEYTEMPTKADMYLYEIYLINLWKPSLNCDDKAPDELTVRLPEPVWTEFTTKLWEKWRTQVHEEEAAAQQHRKMVQRLLEEARVKRREGLRGDAYAEWYEKRSVELGVTENIY